MKVYRLFRHNEKENFTMGYYATEKLAKNALKELSDAYTIDWIVDFNLEKGVLICQRKGYSNMCYAIEDIDVIEE